MWVGPLLQTEISEKLLKSIVMIFVQTFVVPRGGILLIYVLKYSITESLAWL